MSYVNQTAADRFGYDFIPYGYLPRGKDEYWLRNARNRGSRNWRGLESREMEILINNDNSCSNWDSFLVSDPFDPSLIHNTAFYGLVRIGALRKVMLQHHDFRVPAGIRNSTIISCDIGDDVSIRDCSYISHFIIGDNCILSRVDEMQTTNHAKFGNGALKDGEDEDVRVWIDVMNEAGGRPILPFRDMLPADAFLWAAYRDDRKLTEKLKAITQREYGGRRGSYGEVGAHSVIKSCRIIKDVYVGEWAYLKGANKLKNISILSSAEEPTQIGEGVEMVNGIVGYGSNAFYGIKAVRFVMGRCTSLKYGARLIHSVLGDNSTVSCCEILNNLIFPVHEQHHNNSFLIACLVQGMSNIAAGATIGSNHNSRANDGEIRAGRGFWPGLSTTLKHSSRFASFILIAKGDYPYELNIPLPFSLVNNNVKFDRLEVMPAYFWMYNLYALERNSWKAHVRDRRKVKKQYIEADYLAPDTAEEIIRAIALMESWSRAGNVEAAAENSGGVFPPDNEDPEYELHAGDDSVSARGLERNERPTMILKPRKALNAYREMLLYYAVKTIAAYLEENPELSYAAFAGEMERAGGNGKGRVTEWVNLGGQITPAFRVDELREKIRRGGIKTWDAIHSRYDEMTRVYTLDKACHAWETYRYLKAKSTLPGDNGHPLNDFKCFKKELEALVHILEEIAGQIYRSRAKDFDDPFRGITYRNKEEMKQVAGNAGDNSFVKFTREETERRKEAVKNLMKREAPEK